MELKQYLKIIKKNLLFVVLITTIAFLAGNFASKKLQNGFRLEESFIIMQINQTALNNFQITSPAMPYSFSGYYEQEKARNFTDTAVAIFQNSDFSNDIIAPGNTISAQKLAPQLFKVTVSSQNISEAKFDLDRLILKFNQKLKTLSPQDYLQIAPLGTPKEPFISKFDPKIISTASVLLGLTLSLVLIAIKSYFKL